MLKQEIATLFIVATTLVILNKTIGAWEIRLLFLAFFAAMMVSHYATFSLFVLWVLLAIPVLYWLKCRNRVLTKASAILLVVVIFSWYTLIANGAFLAAVAGLSLITIQNLSSGTLTPETFKATAVGLRLAAPIQTPLRLIGRLWFIAFYGLLAVGVLRLILERGKAKFHPEYIALALASFLVLCIHLFVPYWTFAFNVTRMLGISLFILAPVCIVGGEGALYFLVGKIQKLTKAIPRMSRPLHPAIFIFVIVWLLFQSEFIYAVAQEPVYSSQALNPSRDFTRFSSEDETAAIWLMKKVGDSPVVIDCFGRAWLWAYREQRNTIPFSLNSKGGIKPPPEGAYILLRSYNTKHNLLGITAELYVDLDALDLTERTKIYDVGGVQIYR